MIIFRLVEIPLIGGQIPKPLLANPVLVTHKSLFVGVGRSTFAVYISFPRFISGAQSVVNMHWQYYQKAITAYFAASNALRVEAQSQEPFRLPGDGGNILIFE